MKRCPSCNRSYTDASLNFCLEDGTPLVEDAPPASDPNATMRYEPVRQTSEPPPTEIYRPDSPLISQPPVSTAPPHHQQWAPTPSVVTQKKSNAIWWILGGLAALGIIGIGLVVMIIALASMNSVTNSNTNNSNTVNRNDNRNSNVSANANSANSNTGSNAAFVDDFSEQKWGTGDNQFGRIWYSNNEYHMSSKEKTYVVMYAPSDQYGTENATVKVTARVVEGDPPSSGFGVMVHCAKSKSNQLEDYGLLIFPGDNPEYEVIMHKDGNQTPLTQRTASSAIRTGDSPNELEIRVKGSDISFYVNGQYLTQITDKENFKRGRVGFYTSDVSEVAFDDLEINR